MPSPSGKKTKYSTLHHPAGLETMASAGLGTGTASNRYLCIKTFTCPPSVGPPVKVLKQSLNTMSPSWYFLLLVRCILDVDLLAPL